MRAITAFALLTLVIGCATTPRQAPLPAAPTIAQVQAIAGYEFGQSRVPLTVVEDMVVAAMNTGDGRDELADNLAALVASDATPAAKQFALRQLALIGAERHVPAIAPLLLDPELSHMARYAIEPIPGNATDRALMNALDAAQNELKPGIINSLATRGSRRAANMIEGYQASSDPEIAGAAAAAIAKIRG